MAQTKEKQNHYGGSLRISEQELARLVNAIMHDRLKTKKHKHFYSHFCNIRDSMMIIFQWYLGLRQRNVIEIEMPEIKIDQRKLYVPTFKSKSRHHELMTIPRCIIPRMKMYLSIRKRFFPDSKWLFPSRGKFKNTNNHVDPNTYIRMFRNATKLAGLYQVKYIDKQGHKRCARTSHGLRKGSATKVYMVTEDINQVAVHLMHTDERMRATHRYIQCAKESIRERICDRVFDEVWRDPSAINEQTKKLINLLKLSQNKRIPVVNF